MSKSTGGVLRLEPGDELSDVDLADVMLIGHGATIVGCRMTRCDLSLLAACTITECVFEYCVMPPMNILFEGPL